jgi:acetylornithine/N-succinyldiaminopimelate aminotransferase
MNDFNSIKKRAEDNILQTYKRFPVAFIKGKGSRIFDQDNREYLDFGGGIAVNSLGHSHPEIAQTLFDQSNKLTHISNLYYSLPQIELAEKINDLLSNQGKVFLCNSGVEAIECLLKLAKKFGNLNGRSEIITAKNSFHGRSIGGMSATGQDKIKKGFTPLLDGFKHVEFNNFQEIENSLSEKTCAILIEGIQGEGGVLPTTKEYLLKIREVCDKNNILFLMDSVQCGYFRSGKFQSYDRILENTEHRDFKPDAIAMAKSLGSGFPIGLSWITNKFKDILDFGSHGSTYGGNPLGCSVALKTLEIIKRDKLEDNVINLGDYLKNELIKLKDKHPHFISDIRGLGFMLGIEITNINIPDNQKDLTQASVFILKALERGLLAIPSGTNVIRILPALNITKEEIDIGLEKLSNLFSTL